MGWEIERIACKRLKMDLVIWKKCNFVASNFKRK